MGQLVRIGLMFDDARFGLLPDSVVRHGLTGPLPAEVRYFLAFPPGHDYMVGFAGGRLGRALEAEGEAAAIACALGRLEGMLGSDVRRHFRSGTMAGWAANPLTRGAYPAARQGGFAARRALAEPRGGRVFLAGEAMATPCATLAMGVHLHGDAVAGTVAAQLGAPGCTACAARGQARVPLRGIGE